jgi:preprotein translocase subunit SecE
MGVQIPPGLPYTWHGIWQARNLTWFMTGQVASGMDKMKFSIKEKFETAKQFLREVKTELKKVTWPSRKDALSGTVVVLVAVFIIATFLGIVDSGLSNLIKELLKRATS